MPPPCKEKAFLARRQHNPSRTASTGDSCRSTGPFLTLASAVARVQTSAGMIDTSSRHRQACAQTTRKSDETWMSHAGTASRSTSERPERLRTATCPPIGKHRVVVCEKRNASQSLRPIWPQQVSRTTHLQASPFHVLPKQVSTLLGNDLRPLR